MAGCPGGVRDDATDDLRDVLSVMSAGTPTTSAKIAALYARLSPGTVPLAAGGTAALPAALANGVAAAALEFEDAHYLGGAIHPASVVCASAPLHATVADLSMGYGEETDVSRGGGPAAWRPVPG